MKCDYSQFLTQFDSTAITNIDVPSTVLILETYSDATTYDNIYEYVEPEIIVDDNKFTFKFKQLDLSDYIYKKPDNITLTGNTLDDVYELAGISNVPSQYSLAIKLPTDQTVVYFNDPFIEDSTIEDHTIFELNIRPKLYSQYSSYNEYIIYPNFAIESKNDLFNFEKTLNTLLYYSGDYTSDFTNDSTIDSTSDTTIDSTNLLTLSINIPNYDLIAASPIGAPVLNSNFKYGIIFDNSLIGAQISNEFTYSATSTDRTSCTDITQNVIKTTYEYETTSKINGFVLLDTNISNINNMLNFDNTTTIESEPYYINRQHVPPPRYLSLHDCHLYNSTSQNPILNFTIYDNLKHLKVNQHYHTQSKYNNTLITRDTISNSTKNEFIIEFSGYSEIVEL